jgi:hypothetical protein
MHLSLKDAGGVKVRVSDLHSFSVKLWTTDRNVYSEYSFHAPDVYSGIVAGEEIDWIVINAADLAGMKCGAIMYEYHLQAVSSIFKGAIFDRITSGQLNIFLKQ